MSFPRKRESISLCHCEHLLGARQSRIMSLRTFEESVVISFLYTFIFIYLLSLIRILQLVFCISFYFFIISSLTYNPNPLFLYKLNTKYQRLTTDFNNYGLFLYANLYFPNNYAIFSPILSFPRKRESILTMFPLYSPIFPLFPTQKL